MPVGLPEVGQAGHQLCGARPGAVQPERGEPVADTLVGERAQPLGRLHEMAVGVEDRGFHGPPNDTGRDHKRRPAQVADWARRAVSSVPDLSGDRQHAVGPGDAASFAAATGRTDNIYPGHNFL